MYIKNAKMMKLETIKKRLGADMTKAKVKFVDHELDQVASSLYQLNLAINKKWSVWAECVKWPRGNLDSGRHYYEVNFITAEHQQSKFWPGSSSIAKYFGMTEWNRNWTIPKWSFSSGAIGMSRQLDATNSLFYRLEKITGTYVQL